MRVIFLAEKPCALTVNGAYLGTVNGFERTAELEPGDGLFCEFLGTGYLPICFCLNEDFLLNPPPQVKLFYVRGGVAVYCCDFIGSDPALHVLWQETVGGTRLTLFMQGRLQLDLQNETGVHLLSLPEELSDCKPYTCGEEILLEGSAGFAVIARDGTLKLCSEGKITEKGETLCAEIPFADSMGHTAVMKWRDGKLLACSIRSAREPTERTFALALFESVLIGADTAPFLSDALKEKANSLRAFLGKYAYVSLTDDPTLTGLVYERKPRVYDVRYFRVTLSDGKISNIREE